MPPATYMQASSGSGVLNSTTMGASTSQQIEHPADNAKLLARLHIGVFPTHRFAEDVYVGGENDSSAQISELIMGEVVGEEKSRSSQCIC